jgi:uncharacterized membrane protein YfcA
MANDNERQAWIEGLTMAAPALLGGAAGLLLGEIMHRNARRGVAFALLAAGVACLTPAVTDTIVRRLNGPDTERGSRRRLRGIRDAGLATGGFGHVDESLERQAGL